VGGANPGCSWGLRMAVAGLARVLHLLPKLQGISLRRISVRVKKAKKPTRSIRYLLCADRRLQRISLRRMSTPVEKAKKPPRSSRVKNSARAGNLMRLAWGMNPRVIVLGVMCVMTAAVLIAARQPSPRADSATVDAPPDNVAMSARLETKKAVVPRAPATPAAKGSTTDRSMEHTQVVESVKTVAVASASKAPPVESTVKALAVESTPPADLQNSAPVTITGCLELHEETFWLKDTSGADAPKSRSWRSGFLKKRPASIELVDAADTLRLPNYVGQRVAATGMRMHRELRVRSLQRIAASCR